METETILDEESEEESVATSDEESVATSDEESDAESYYELHCTNSWETSENLIALANVVVEVSQVTKKSKNKKDPTRKRGHISINNTDARNNDKYWYVYYAEVFCRKVSQLLYDDETISPSKNSEESNGKLPRSVNGISSGLHKNPNRTLERIRNGNRSYSCRLCKKRFPSNSYLKKHTKMVHKRSKPSSNTSENGLPETSDLTRQEKENESHPSYSCSTCEETFTSNTKLKKHQLKHGNEKHLSCEKCNKKFYSRTLLMKHKKTHMDAKQNDEDVKQNHVDANQNHVDAKQNHVGTEENHVAVKAFLCSKHDKSGKNDAVDTTGAGCFLCNIFGPKKKTFGIKRKTKTYTCSVCKKTFQSIRTLRSHQQIHARDDYFKCNICEQSFKEESELKTHLLAHNNDKLFTCKVCREDFRDTCSLRTHQVKHAGDTPFSCKLCEKKYKYISLLKKHSFTHTNDKPFLCKVCGTAFAHKSVWRTHRLTHVSRKPFTRAVRDRTLSFD